jgi:hypothetical protein
MIGLLFFALYCLSAIAYWVSISENIYYKTKLGFSALDIILQILFLPLSMLFYSVFLVVYLIHKIADLQVFYKVKKFLKKDIIKFR